MQIEMRRTDSLKPYANNPRRNEAAIDQVAASLKKFNWRQPIVCDEDDVIIVGHTRWLAAQRLGMTEVPVHVARGLTKAQVKALRLADNRSHEYSSWDFDKLRDEFTALKEMGADLADTLFPADQLAEVLAGEGNPGLTDPDDVPEPPDAPITQPGDIWLLGDHHRLMAGDSGSVSDLDRLLNGAHIHLCNCDPPYNVKVESRSNAAIAAGNSSFTKGNAGHAAAANHEGLTHHQSFDLHRRKHTITTGDGSKVPSKYHGMDVATGAQTGRIKSGTKMRAKDRPLLNDFVSDEAFAEMLLAWFGNMARVLEPGRSLYIWGGYANIANYPSALKACNLYFSQTIIWVKEHPVLTRKDFMGNHEWCFYCWKHDAGHKWFGPNNATDVWSIKKVNPQSMCHLTEKPVELAIRAINYSSRAGENVLDLFGGSGSTLIGCEQTGRNAYIMELDLPYCDVICDRFMRFTGKAPVRERDGLVWSSRQPQAALTA